MSDSFYVLLVTLGLTTVSVVNRSFFFLFERDVPMPDTLKRGLRHAPLAALIAVIAPDIVLTHGQLVFNPRDPRLYSALVAAAYALWRRGILGTIVVGMLVFWGLKFGLGFQ
ncbi:MAG: AzlD domain-containing protein [Myxococcales bacterium]